MILFELDPAVVRQKVAVPDRDGKIESAPIQRHLNHFDRWSSMAVASTEVLTFFYWPLANALTY